MPFYPSTLRDSPVGQLINHLSNGKYLPYADQRPDFVVPAAWRLHDASSSSSDEKSQLPRISADAAQHPTTARSSPAASSAASVRSAADADADIEADAASKCSLAEKKEPSQLPVSSEKEQQDAILVGWYSDDDEENPRNWPLRQKVLTTLLISALTFTVYASVSIYTPSVPGVMAEFGVSQRQAILGLSLYLFAVGLGPLILSPLTEIASIGRNKIYFTSLILFLAFSFVAAFAPNYSTLMAARFFQGIFASPALSTGGATLGDIWSPQVIAYFIATWAIGAVCGPTLGPIVSGFAAMNSTWRWSLYLIVILASVALIGLSFSFPETSAATILYHRAARLRKLTGNDRLRSQSELDQSAIEPLQLVKTSLLRPFVLSTEPMLAFSNLYLGLAYACFYLFFESFPIVFTRYGFNMGLQTLPFLSILAGALAVLPPYLAYLRYVVEPRFKRDGTIVPESRLEVALVASFLVPVSLLVWGWSANRTHWIVPCIGAALYVPGLFLLFQSLLTYQPMSYPAYVGSVMAANAFARSSVAAAFPLFGEIFFERMGVDVGSTILAGITIVMIPFLYALKRYGHVLRAKSKYATA